MQHANLEELSQAELDQLAVDELRQHYATNLLDFARNVCSEYLWTELPSFHSDIYAGLQHSIMHEYVVDERVGTPLGVKKLLTPPQISQKKPNNNLLRSTNPGTNNKVANPQSTNSTPTNPQRGDDTGANRLANTLNEGEASENANEQTIRNLSLVMPREFGKSTIMWIAAMWAALHQYKKYVVYTSSSEEKAVELIQPIKRECESNNFLRAIYGDQTTKEWSKGSFVLRNGTKFLARGRGQNVRGLRHLAHRPDLVILDDIEDDKRVDNKALREEDQKWFDTQVRKGVDSQRGSIVCVGTILHIDSMMSNLALKENRPKKYRSFTPLIFNALNKDDKSIWEEKFKTQALYDERDQDPFGFAQERMNRPISFQRGYFKQSHFKYHRVDGGEIYTQTKTMPMGECNVYLTCDLANTEDTMSDFTVILAAAVDENYNIYVLDYFRGKYADPHRIVDEIFRMSDYWKPDLVGVEDNNFQKWLMPILQKDPRYKHYLSTAFIPLKADRKKVRRIGSLQPRFVNGSVYFTKDMKDLEDELLMFPSPPHDDISDALAYVPNMMSMPIVKREKKEISGTFKWWKNTIRERNKALASNRKKMRMGGLIPV